jgi:uncharacterized protein
MAGTLEDRRAALEENLHALGRVAVAFSGGVDSAVLLAEARRVLGEGAVAVIADSPSLPRAELTRAREEAAALGARLVEVSTDELSDPRYRANAGDRCYWCKEALFRAMELVAEREGIAHLAFGEITDDAGDDRPGARSASERGVRAPLAEAGLSKSDVRALAREHGLAAADVPSSACLASRIPVGTTVTAERLARVEEAERRVRALGFRRLRVRDRGTCARLEVGEDELSRAEALRGDLTGAITAAGFVLDELAAYRDPAAAEVET